MFFIPALAGYIAYAIADRPGIAPGFVMGGLAANIFDVTDGGGSGFPPPASSARSSAACSPASIAHWITGWKVPTWARGLMPVLVIPLLTAILAGLPDDRGVRQADRLADGPAQRRARRHERRSAPSCSAWSSG